MGGQTPLILVGSDVERLGPVFCANAIALRASEVSGIMARRYLSHLTSSLIEATILGEEGVKITYPPDMMLAYGTVVASLTRRIVEEA